MTNKKGKTNKRSATKNNHSNKANFHKNSISKASTVSCRWMANRTAIQLTFKAIRKSIVNNKFQLLNPKAATLALMSKWTLTNSWSYYLYTKVNRKLSPQEYHLEWTTMVTHVFSMLLCSVWLIQCLCIKWCCQMKFIKIAKEKTINAIFVSIDNIFAISVKIRKLLLWQ